MRVFDFNPAHYRQEYESNGFVRVENGVGREFYEFALAQAKRLISGNDTDLKDWQFKGKKAQFLFEFPSGSDWPAGVKSLVADLCGMPRSNVTLCERHIKAYDAEAPVMPPPHKDRLASEVAVGVPLIVAEGSHLVLYPQDYCDINPFGSTATYRNLLDEDAVPEKLFAGVEPVRLDMQPGDVVLFRGSSIYHERFKAANSVVLYFKFNSLRLDPLGEDPSTPARREASLSFLNSERDPELLQLALEASPRLDRVTRLYSRLEWDEVLTAQIWNGKEFRISEQDLSIIKAADGVTPIADLLGRLGFSRTQYASALPGIRRLVRLQALDLVRCVKEPASVIDLGARRQLRPQAFATTP